MRSKTTYIAKIMCSNCRTIVTVSIPKGISVHHYCHPPKAPARACGTCGCQTLNPVEHR